MLLMTGAAYSGMGDAGVVWAVRGEFSFADGIEGAGRGVWVEEGDSDAGGDASEGGVDDEVCGFLGDMEAGWDGGSDVSELGEDEVSAFCGWEVEGVGDEGFGRDDPHAVGCGCGGVVRSRVGRR